MNYYVYGHYHPVTGELVYVGYGSRDRAWKCPVYNEKHKTTLRSKEHIEWMETLIAQGHCVNDWVQLRYTGLSKAGAYSLEQNWIKYSKPLFNKSQREVQTKVTAADYALMVSMRESGKTYQQIVDAVGWSMMTVWNHLNLESIHNQKVEA